ncbi:MAG TPA: PLD nuclease N-terminal domain-containing protein [Verrucomicrobiae bacterium]|nr:PLD nuclease N-terminal domain-containing protein [Verrucomicrobiae bacterium]
MNIPLLFAAIDLGGLLPPLCGLLFLMFWIAMLVDCVNHETRDKIGWILVLIFLGIIGAPLYFFIRRLPRRRAQRLTPGSPLYQPWKKDQEIR